MKRVFLHIALMLLPLGLYAETATEVVQRFLQAVEKQELTSSVTLTISESATQPLVYPGSIRMQGEQFALKMFDQEGAYDGHSLYMYSEATDELTISVPTQEELMEVNPILFAKALLLTAQVRFSATTPKSGYSIDFIPNNKAAGIQKFVLRLSADMLPEEITIYEGKKRSSVRFNKPHYGKSSGPFVIEHPQAFLNDLR